VRNGERYRLTLTVHEGGVARERTMESDSCTDLAGAAAVALGLLLRHAPDPNESGDATTGGDGASDGATSASGTETTTDPNQRKTTDSSSARGAPSQRTEKTSQNTKNIRANEHPETSDETPSPDSPDGARHLHFLLRAPVVTGALVNLPAASVGIGGGLGLRYDAWRFLAHGRVFAGQTLRAAGEPDAGARVSRVTAELTACRGWRSEHLEFAPCLGATLDRYAAGGAGADVVARSQISTAAAVEAGGTAHLYIVDWAAVVVSANVGIKLSRPRFVVEGLGHVGGVGAAELSAGVGSEWIF